MSSSAPTFTVDTHLFRELGELLVGRDSTALVELIKNAYDADAEIVTIEGHLLDEHDRARIVVRDDGNGMTPAQFGEGFLRIASRLKETGERRSRKFKRRYTGAKGIGRLAAHKLARELRILSYPAPEDPGSGDDLEGVDARIDWDAIERLQTIDEVQGSNALSVRRLDHRPAGGHAVLELTGPGTVIELRRLRRRWSDADRANFFAEVQSYQPAEALSQRNSHIIPKRLLFDSAKVADVTTRRSTFSIELKGDFATGHEYWANLVQVSQFVFEVVANADSQSVDVAIGPTCSGKAEYATAQVRQFEFPHPSPDTKLSFQARIFIREGGGGTVSERQWLGRTSGIRVFMEGFRVLPYGEPKDDWLGLDADYKRRSRALPLLADVEDAGQAVDKDEALVFLGNKGYYGAVFLVQNQAPTLQMLVNREGFIPDAGYQAMVEILRKAVYLTVRYRALVKQPGREKRSEDREAAAAGRHDERVRGASRQDLKGAVEASVRRASELAKDARQAAANSDFQGAAARIEEAANEFKRGSEASERLMSEGAILRVLASVGMQMASFVHEVNSLLGSARAVESVLDRIRADDELPKKSREQLDKLQSAVGELRRSVERQAVYLTDVVSPDARRRRSRQRLSERFDSARRLIDDVALRREIEITNDIPSDLRSPPMFPAELTTVFTNVLTNAIKAAGDHGRIRAGARKSDPDGTYTVVRIENTGVAVDLDESERWFRPFESTTAIADPILGQGMGMGLPITRNMLAEYGATIRFESPSHGFATALEIQFPS